MICALLVLGTPDLPAPLGDLSPWLDHRGEPVEDVVAHLETQRHRRFIKTHTPPGRRPAGRPGDLRRCGAAPLDMAVSLYHQGDNIDRKRVAELTGVSYVPRGPRPPTHDWLVEWTREETTPAEQMDSLVGVLHHVGDAWTRAHAPGGADNVVLVHYVDLQADLPGQMHQLAIRLGIDIPQRRWPSLFDAATFASMRSRSDVLMPNALGVLKDGAAFFRSGRSGTGREQLTAGELAAYER